MVLKSINLAITDYCNSRCTMCNIWRNKPSQKMSVEDYKELFNKPEFKNVEEISVSGGEPLLRKDLFEITDAIIDKLPCLKKLFLNTNGTNPSKTKEFVKFYASKIKELFICVSIDGDKETNKQVRGIDSYNSALETITQIQSLKYRNVNTIISTTLTEKNCNLETLEYLKALSEKTNSNFTFRLARKNSKFYLNQDLNLRISEHMKEEILKFIKEQDENPFMKIYREYLKTWKVPLMGDKNAGVKCAAGDVFIFIQADGTIYPCMNSTRKIGDKKGIYTTRIPDLGRFEPCPCCTECHIYPMITYLEHRGED